MKNRTINVKGKEIAVSRTEQADYISLTDIARYKNPNEPIDIIKNWLRSRTTVEFIGLWEQLHNPDFKAVEFDRFMYEAGSNTFARAAKGKATAPYSRLTLDVLRCISCSLTSSIPYITIKT